ncbi:hypothetical protein [Leucothrix arctica]|uniref:Uncharacterized protein n=1 Tax=Leucothrix arctica TaxID=1481894 RepID=A0A317C381_9GAMM|nr:hypothetical protein [Leucothrix arctica]PWQ93084.1 hypothetical protein DKT75_20555 [Leucothrix arctica]
MLLQEIESDPDLKRLVFEFFYCFSRFEFSLKANEHAKKNRKVHSEENEIHKVAADWGKFWRTYEKSYVLSSEARELLSSHYYYK